MSSITEEEAHACLRDFFHFAKNHLKVNHYLKATTPFEQYPFHARLVNAFNDDRFVLVPKYRQGGFTTLLALWSLWRCVTKCDQYIMFMHKTDRESVYTSRIVRYALDHLSSDWKPDLGKCNDHCIEFKDTGSTLFFHTPQAARGKAVSTLIIDEAAYIKDMDQHWKAIYPCLKTGGSCIVCSTPNGIGNWFQEAYIGSLTGKNTFKVVNVRYDEHPEFQDKAKIAELVQNLGLRGFHQEMLCNFLQ